MKQGSEIKDEEQGSESLRPDLDGGVKGTKKRLIRVGLDYIYTGL